MRFIDLAWAAFIYRGFGYDEAYINIMSQRPFLSRLRTHPSGLSIDEIDQNLLKFLNQWKCRCSKSTGTAIQSGLASERKLVKMLATKTLMTLTENQIHQAEQVYDTLDGFKGIGPAIAGKTLHIVNPQVFLPLDNSVLEAFKKDARQQGGDESGSPFRYGSFLTRAKEDAISVTDDFNSLKLPGSPAEYISTKLGYESRKTLAKYLDEYYWITSTIKVQIPPSWDPTKIDNDIAP